MARPAIKQITFEIDGRQVTAPEGTMLVDAAKHGDVEIPYFCYEPKLGAPVGACRMCLVEIEGIPKLQTSCSTPVKDGMVVHTTTDRVKHAQNAVVEFLLVNHPLDCPVCDKGGECPLQDISYGWGAGKSRMIEPKRHFKKPLEVSPLVAIDRERCILCYRCVRFSQEIAEDYQLVFLERGDHTFVGTHDGRPYVAPFSGNIIELCPVGALTSTAYRFRARPWDVEEAGSVCIGCASQCNVSYTVRDDDKVLRVLARDNDEVDDGWVCDKGRFGYESFHSPDRVLAPRVRDGGVLREVSWERALGEAAKALTRGGEKTAALAGGAVTNEEGLLLARLLRDGLGSPHLDSRATGAFDPCQARVLARPELTARVSDIDYADAILVVELEPVDEAPVLDLRIRKARRRHGASVITLTSRPSSLDDPGSELGADPGGDVAVRFAPGAAEAALAALAAALGSPRIGSADGEPRLSANISPKVGVHPSVVADLAAKAGADPAAIEAAAAALREARFGGDADERKHGDVVVMWGERTTVGKRGAAAVDALLAVTGALEIGERPESGLIEIGSRANGRGLREVGVAPKLAAGLADSSAPGLSAAEIGPALAAGELSTLLLVAADPQTELSDRPTWERAYDRAEAVVAFSDFITPGLAEHATVVFPSESNAEKEGTLTHPDGRLQRVRQAVPHAGAVRPVWAVLAELCARAGKPLSAPSSNGSGPSLSLPDVTAAVTDAVPFYAGITLDEIGGRGVRWQDRDAASAAPEAELPSGPLESPPDLPTGLQLGAAPALFASPAVEHSPSLRFLAPRQRAELSPDDAQRLGIAPGEDVEVSSGDRVVRATAAIRAAIRPGSVFLTQGLGAEGAEALTNGAPRTVEVRSAPPLIHQVGEDKQPQPVAAGETGGSAATGAPGGPDTPGAGGSDAPGDPSEVVPEPGEAAREAHPAREGDRASDAGPTEDYPS
ncbi:MAG TPA: NADH-quinone oxidoreductase subunit NuoG [Thermoleophilaceae bacterium]|nr:NADH-quinone oxidoreductase subunit NuoG [Thermoleophilaceae bacterium]